MCAILIILLFSQIEVDRWLEDIVITDGNTCKGEKTYAIYKNFFLL